MKGHYCIKIKMSEIFYDSQQSGNKSQL
uniref:Uncharacterized protein n=1 Tax=Arundo donax TaxID=35708 RepID=A0A0A9DKW4_ARUDO